MASTPQDDPPAGTARERAARAARPGGDAAERPPAEEAAAPPPIRTRGVTFSAALVLAALLALVVAAAVLFWQLAHILLVLFAGVLAAVLLDAMVRFVQSLVPLPRVVALALVVAAFLGAAAAFGAAGGPQVADQAAELRQRLPEAASQLESAVRDTRWGRALLRGAPSAQELLRSGAQLVGWLPGVFSTLVGALTGIAFVSLIGLYTAFNPALYISGALQLVPPAWRPRAEEVLEALGHALRWWLLGRLGAMSVVAVLTAIGLWLIDLPLALALAAIAGLFSFVPFLGPIAAAIPALMVALVESFTQAVLVVIVYSAVQFVEGNFITPIIQRRAVSLPPAVLVSSQLSLGILFGLVGVLLATPLTVVIMVLVQTLYVQQVLHSDVTVLGEKAG